jgi:hypothetical protein
MTKPKQTHPEESTNTQDQPSRTPREKTPPPAEPPDSRDGEGYVNLDEQKAQPARRKPKDAPREHPGADTK